HFLFQLRLGHHRIQRRLGIRVLLWPYPVAPVNVLDGALISDALLERERSLKNVRRRFSTEKAEFTRRGGQCPTYQETCRGSADNECIQNSCVKEAGLSSASFSLHSRSFSRVPRRPI